MRKLLLSIFLFLLTLVILFAGCRSKSIPDIEIIAKVGDQYLTRDQLLKWMPPNLPEEQKVIVARQYIDRWVQKTSMAITAEKEGVELSPYEDWSIENLKKEMLVQRYIDAKLPRDIIITDEEISNYYDKNKDEFIRDQNEVHLVQLYLENLDKAIAEEIRELKSLQEVIQKNFLENQVNRMVEKNGDLGYVPEENLRPEIQRIVRTGSTGKIYGPIKIESGYYYFQMMDKQKAGSYRSLDLMKDEIRTRLISIKREKLSEDLAKKIAEKMDIEVHMEHIK
jgi:parvulin-like peptidyl-prolyl isomerase